MWCELADSVRERHGQPVTLARVVAEWNSLRIDLLDPANSIALNSVPTWHEWAKARPFYCLSRSTKPGTLQGYTYKRGCGGSTIELHRPDLAQFGRTTEILGWECDIQDVMGFSASKSDLEEFSSLEAMVERNSREMIDEISERKLEANLSHGEIRVLHDPGTTDCFVRHLWDGRLFLANSGGSHHFAAARYIAKRLGRPVPLKGTLVEYSINADAARSLLRDFDIFAVAEGEASATNAMHAALRRVRATYYWHQLPRPYEKDIIALLLPRNDPRARSAAAVLRAGDMIDLGRHIRALTERQADAKLAFCDQTGFQRHRF